MPKMVAPKYIGLYWSFPNYLSTLPILGSNSYFPYNLISLLALVFIFFIWQHPRNRAFKCEVTHGRKLAMTCSDVSILICLGCSMTNCDILHERGLNILPILGEKSEGMLSHFLCGTLNLPKLNLA